MRLHIPVECQRYISPLRHLPSDIVKLVFRLLVLEVDFCLCGGADDSVPDHDFVLSL